MGVMAIDSGVSLRGANETSAKLRKESRDRDELLDQLLNDIFHSGAILRDYLLENEPVRAERQKHELESIRIRMTDTLREYGRHVPADERQEFDGLVSRTKSYWDSQAVSLEWNAATRRRMGETFLREVVIPRRHEVVDLAKQITALNQRDLDSGEAGMELLQLGFRRRFNRMSVTALLLGFVLACVIMRRVSRLEADTAARFAEVEEARRNLRRLSDRLVIAQEEERRSISRELHDEIGQVMSATLVELGRLESATPGAAAWRERLATVRSTLESCVRSVRDMALLLRPSMLDDLGLVAALRWQAREVARRSGLNVKMITEEVLDKMPDSHRTCIYRVVQEALNNCAKHSKATQVRVFVKQDEEGMWVSVEDDGIGFDPAQERGMGLLGMEERVARLGGLFSIEATSGSGTILSIRFPLPDSQLQLSTNGVL